MLFLLNDGTSVNYYAGTCLLLDAWHIYLVIFSSAECSPDFAASFMRNMGVLVLQ